MNIIKHFQYIGLLIFCFGFWILINAFTKTTPKEYPQKYFRSPVNKAIRLSGTFGELRPNHLHSGIDIKAWNGKTGQPIFAAAEGYVARIKVQSGGYGNVLYISHPNGYTTVYAHLGTFPKDIAAYVKKAQYEQQSFEVELFPPKGKFAFAKGAKIGTMGLSGRSYGPHLHFEIRDTKTEKPINPLLFGFDVEDNVKPKLHQLKVYFLNEKRETLTAESFELTKIKNGSYRIKSDTLRLGAWRVGLGLKVYDHHNGTPNWNGIFSLTMLQNDVPVYAFEMESFAFRESRYINAHLDYEEQISNKAYFNRCYALPGNRLSIYDEMVKKGVIKLHKDKPSKITMKAKDVKGNTSVLEFWVRRDDVKSAEATSYNYMLPHAEENLIETEAIRLFFPKGTFYENLYMDYSAAVEKSNNVYSAIHHVHNYKTPVHKYFDVAIQPFGLPEALRSKAFIAYCDKDNEIQNCGGQWKNGKLQAKVRDLGDYSIMVDDEAPKIKPVAFSANMKGYSKISFKITDNFPTARNIEQFNYEITIDGKWVLFNYDAKNDLLIHRFDGTIQPGKHTLKLVVTDDRGNQSVFEKEFVR